MEIKYIGFFELENSTHKRVATIAAVNKMKFVIESLENIGCSVHVVSPSWSELKEMKVSIIKSKIVSIAQFSKITFSPTISMMSKFGTFIKISYSLFWLFVWLIKNVKKNEKILVYHVQWFALPLLMAKKIINFKIVLEVEEIYSEVWANNTVLNSWERILLKIADEYITVSDILADKLGKNVKSIVYGNYNLPINSLVKRYTFNKIINVVYSGSIDSTKGGAMNAVACSEFLPPNYRVNISGGGNESEIIKMKNLIQTINSNLGREACKYVGVIEEKEFSDFLLSNMIALNPQIKDNKFDFLFPSKIIKYLTHNLIVISTSISSIKSSKVASLIKFVESDDVHDFVKAILEIDINIQKDNSIFFKDLKLSFEKDLIQIFIPQNKGFSLKKVDS